MASGINYIDSLLPSWQPRWNASSPVGTGTTVTYSFLSSVPTYYPSGAEERGNFGVLNATQIDGAKRALQLWSEVSGLDFVEVSDAGAGGQIRFGTANLGTSGTVAHAYYPGGNQGGDVWLNNIHSANSTQTEGSLGFLAMLHEVGHALGLKHSFDGTKGNPVLPTAEESRQYTVMSYSTHPNMGGLEPSTPMLYDIAAIQYLYGADYNTRAGNDTYSWNPSTAFIKAIWDGGGTDTLSAANQSLAANLNLNAGSYSSIGPLANNSGTRATNNLAIAFGATIENALGGSGNDTITGNAVANSLSGNNGNDNLAGNDGNDTLDGGLGNDTLNGGNGNDTFNVSSGSDTIYGGAGSDVLNADYSALSGGYGLSAQEVETFIFKGSSGIDNLTMYGSTDTFYGNAGNDTFDAGSLNDFLDGGDGNDTLIGGDGNDTIIGGWGDDNLSGGEGNDLLDGSWGFDTLIGGNGTDTATYDFYSGGINANLATGQVSFPGNSTITEQLISIENVTGSRGNDTILGDSLNNSLVGNLGNDVLTGGDGNDVLTGSMGNDILTGGAGADLFVFNYLSEGIDTIKDFLWGQGDKVQIVGATFGASSTSQFAFDFGSKSLSFNGQQFASFENLASASDFIPSLDMTIV